MTEVGVAPAPTLLEPPVLRVALKAVGLSSGEDATVPTAPSARRSTGASSAVIYNETLEGFGGAYIRRYAGSGRAVAVLRIKTFLPPQINASSSSSVLVEFYQFVWRLEDAARDAGATELVFDVSSNTGGYIALQDLFLRALDERYDLRWDLPNSADPQRPTLVAPTDVNVRWSRSYLRADIQASPIGGFYTAMLNGSSVYAEANPQPRTNPAWFDPVGRTFSGATPFYHRAALFFARRPNQYRFSAVTVLSDGYCGSACCMFVERLARHGVAGATAVRFVGFGGDPADASFQMGEFCGGSVQKMCAALQTAGVTQHPHQTGAVTLDPTFVDTVWYASRGDTQPVQLSPRAFAVAVLRDYDALGDSDAAHERRMQSGYSGSIDSGAAMRGLGVTVGLLLGALAALV